MTEDVRERATDAGVSEETLKVLDEIKKDGEEFEGIDNKTPEKTPDELAKETADKKATDDKKAADDEATRKAEEAAKNNNKNGSDDKGEKPVSREPKTVPVGKFNQLRHDHGETKAQLEAERAAKVELERKLADAIANKPNTEVAAKGNNEEIKKAAKALAEKHGADEEFVEELALTISDLISKNAPKAEISEEIKTKLNELDEAKAETTRKNKEMQEDADFEQGFAGLLTEFPELANSKEDFKQLAFTDGYETTPLRTLAAAYMHDNKPKKTAEASGSGKSSGVIDYEALTEEDIKNLPREEFTKYMKWYEKKHGANSSS